MPLLRIDVVVYCGIISTIEDMKKNNTGLIQFIILVVVVILLLSYFNIDIRGIVESPQTQANFNYISGFIKLVWVDYLSRPVLYFWNNIFINLLWESFVSNLERIKRGESSDFELNAPYVPLSPVQ